MELVVENDYAYLLQVLNDHSGYSSSIIHHIKHHIVPLLPNRHLFVDVGPGIGIVARALSKYFDQCVLVGPLKKLPNHQSLGLGVMSESYQECRFDTPISFMLAAHVFHSIPLEKWPMIIKKMLHELAPGGILMLSAAAPRGIRHHLCEQLNPEHRHSAYLKRTLDELSLEYTSQENHVIFTTQTAERMAEILGFIVSEICFPPHGLSSLSEEEKIEFESLILNLTHSLETARHNYHFRQEDDWFFLQKPV